MFHSYLVCVRFLHPIVLYFCRLFVFYQSWLNNLRSVRPHDYAALHAGKDLENEEFHDSFDISPETAPPGTSHGNSASQSSTPLVPTREAHGLQDKIAAGISRCYFFFKIDCGRACWGVSFAHLESRLLRTPTKPKEWYVMKEHGYSTSVPSVGLCHASLLGTPSFLRIVPAFRPLKALLWILLLPRPLDFQVGMGFQITIVFQNLMIQDFFARC